ncbi:hypothetical protein [Streptomyces sp. NPDC058964]|uniref:hypothetical protein n=1 Tax=Streptomyces sp. NPDC058964 TaxID=3346681 RepID=UPI0036B916B0
MPPRRAPPGAGPAAEQPGLARAFSSKHAGPFRTVRWQRDHASPSLSGLRQQRRHNVVRLTLGLRNGRVHHVGGGGAEYLPLKAFHQLGIGGAARPGGGRPGSVGAGR